MHIQECGGVKLLSEITTLPLIWNSGVKEQTKKVEKGLNYQVVTSINTNNKNRESRCRVFISNILKNMLTRKLRGIYNT